MPSPTSLYWQYINEKCVALGDPRIPLTRHTGWQMPTTLSIYSGAEPDNYNFAIFDTRPHDFKFIRHQCWYRVDHSGRNKIQKGWISLYVAEERLQAILFNREILKLQPLAVWRYDKAKPIRIKRTELQREKFHPKNKPGVLTTEERLYQQGYYEKFITKYFDDEKFLKVVGAPRGVVQTPEQEVLEYDGL